MASPSPAFLNACNHSASVTDDTFPDEGFVFANVQAAATEQARHL